jgi:hypothetical protein
LAEAAHECAIRLRLLASGNFSTDQLLSRRKFTKPQKEQAEMNREPSRRQFLQLGNAAVLTSLLAGKSFGETMELREAKDAVDHLVLGVSDLDRGIEWFEQKTGVRPVVGGRHPNRGTQNALASFSNRDSSGVVRQYLEIMAPDPQQAGHERGAELLKLSSPRLVLWASATTEIDKLARAAKAAKLAAAGPLDGSRVRPDGKLLKWRTLYVAREADKGLLYFNVLPFFIQWAEGSPHPSQDSPRGCRLLSLEFAHPEPAAIRAAMKSLGINAKVSKATAPAIKATLQTPKGKVELV